jgi:hypothetical protein
MSIVDVTEKSERRFEPDVAITRHPRDGAYLSADAATATLDPVNIRNIVEEETREA